MNTIEKKTTRQKAIDTELAFISNQFNALNTDIDNCCKSEVIYRSFVESVIGQSSYWIFMGGNPHSQDCQNFADILAYDQKKSLKIYQRRSHDAHAPLECTYYYECPHAEGIWEVFYNAVPPNHGTHYERLIRLPVEKNEAPLLIPHDNQPPPSDNQAPPNDNQAPLPLPEHPSSGSETPSEIKEVPEIKASEIKKEKEPEKHPSTVKKNPLPRGKARLQQRKSAQLKRKSAQLKRRSRIQHRKARRKRKSTLNRMEFNKRKKHKPSIILKN